MIPLAKPPSLVIFDCDGVLVDSEPIFLRVLHRYLHSAGASLSFEDCRAKFIGKSKGDVEDYLNEYNLFDIVKLTGHISRKESLEYQMRASILLLLIGIVPPELELTYGLSGKVFDYILSKKNILCLSNGGATREFIVENKIGDIFFHNDQEGIKNYLIQSFDKFNNNKLGPVSDISNYNEFDFRSLSEKLSDQFESLVM